MLTFKNKSGIIMYVNVIRYITLLALHKISLSKQKGLKTLNGYD